MERQLVNNPYLKQNYTASISDAVFLNNTCQTAGALYIDGVQHTVGPNVNFTGKWEVAAREERQQVEGDIR